MAAGKPEGSDYQLGELDIPGVGARPPRPAQPRPEVPKPLAAGASEQDVDSFGARDLGGDFGDSMFGGAALELDESASPRPVAQPKSVRSTSQAPAAPPVRVHQQNAAVGSSVPRDTNANVLTALQELGDFGDPPTGWVSSGRYAIHVGLRLLALRKERKRVVAALTAAESAHRAALESLGETLLAHGAAGNPALKAFVDGVQGARDQVSQADNTLSQARAEARAAIAELDQRREALLQELAPYEEAERAAQGVVRKAEEDLKRGQAWVKRVEIESRALSEAATPNPAKLAELEKQLEERESAVEAFEAALVAVQAKLSEAQRELSVKRSAVDALDGQRRALESGALAKESAIGKQTHAAGEAYRTALRGLAEAARERGLAVGPASQAAERVEETANGLDEARVSLDHHDRARTLYDHAGLRKGTALLITLAVLGLLLLLLHPGFDVS